MGGKGNITLSYIFSLMIVFVSRLQASVGKTITPAENITDPNTLVSSTDGIFTLGFFSPGNSRNRYVGIWYTNIAELTIVWVANRDRPLNDSSGVLRIGADGNLVLLDKQGERYWTTNVSNFVSKNSVAELLDTGNLVLREITTRNYNTILWQSFDHPTDTLLPMMTFGVNLRTGEEQVITSWKDDSDPAAGNFSLELSPSVPPQLIIKKGSERNFRSGPWMQLKGETRGEFAKYDPSKTGLDLVRDPTEGTVYLMISDEYNASTLRIVLDSDGQLREKQWDKTKKEWRNNWSSPVTEYCDVYNICGPFGACNPYSSPICRCWKGFEPKFINEWNDGNWSSGCVRSKELQCEIRSNNATTKGTDVFGPAHVRKLPDYSYSLEGINTDMQCKEGCLNNCSCTAYLFDGTQSYYSNECLLWMGGLVDVQVVDPDLPIYFNVQIRDASDVGILQQ